jgi:hypothetical protein
MVQTIGIWLAIAAWCVWWLWGVDWRKAWPALASGGWSPALLILIVSAVVWATVSPGEWVISEGFKVPHFWRHVGGVAALAGLALFCGWLQGRLGWAPAEIAIEPPGSGSEHGHGHH